MNKVYTSKGYGMVNIRGGIYFFDFAGHSTLPISPAVSQHRSTLVDLKIAFFGSFGINTLYLSLRNFPALMDC